MAVSSVIANADFESGDTGWTKGGNWKIVEDGTAQTGTWDAHIDTNDPGVGSETSELINANQAICVEGTSITATAKVLGVGADGNVAAVFIEWLDSSSARISKSTGNSSNPGSHNVWETSTVTATAPAGTAYARVGIIGTAVSNGACRVDNVSWNYTSDRAISLTSPVDGQTYASGTSIPLSVSLTGTVPDVTSVTYKDGVTTLSTVTSAPYSSNVSTLTDGAHSITAEALLTNGTTITSSAAAITVGTTTPADTREFKASTSYAFLVMSNFVGLASSMPLTAQVKGVEIIVDYLPTLLVRSKDIDVEDPVASNPNVIFDIMDGCTLKANILSSSGNTYNIEGSGMVVKVPISSPDFSITEQGTSEEKKWTVFTGTASQVTLGGSTELFGLNPVQASDFLTRSISFRFFPNFLTKPAYADSGDACVRFSIDKVRVRIYFDAGSAEYYFASADKTKVIKGNLVSANLTDGDFKTGDGTGVLQLDPTLTVMDGVQTWIGDDWTIHAAYPPTDANQIGNVAARLYTDGIGMSYNGLPCSEDVVNNRSRYQFITANFFATRELDSIYGVNGYSRAFAYNGDFFYKIYTQGDADKDEPRHIAYHHGHLALGYDDGRVDISVIGQPYNFSGVDGASEWSIGDKVTGLLPLSGTILGIFGSKSIWGLSGTTVDNFATQVVAPNIGAIEYTIADMGYPVYANAYGIYTLGQTQQYGDYLGSPMSQDVSPWLRPRLVRKYTSDKEVVCAWPVRSKNQYKLAFLDGSILSMTLNAGQQTAPTFSFQQYTIYGPSDE